MARGGHLQRELMLGACRCVQFGDFLHVVRRLAFPLASYLLTPACVHGAPGTPAGSACRIRLLLVIYAGLLSGAPYMWRWGRWLG